MTPRETFGFECDHMRPVVRCDDGWHHIDAEGRVVPIVCTAGAYKVEATYSGDHTMNSFRAASSTQKGNQ